MENKELSKEEIVDYYIEYLKERMRKVNWKKVGLITAGVIVTGATIYIAYKTGSKDGYKLGWSKGNILGYFEGWESYERSQTLKNALKGAYEKGYKIGSKEMKDLLMNQLSNLSEDSKFVQFLYDRYSITHVGSTIFRRMG